jgi:SnoaL-like domain
MSSARVDAASWAERYFQAWKTNEPEAVGPLFTPDATYFYGPFREPARGRDEIVRRWVQNGIPLDFRYEYDIVATSGDVAVIHWTVSWREAGTHIAMDGVLIVTLDDRGACREHREWYARVETPVSSRADAR